MRLLLRLFIRHYRTLIAVAIALLLIGFSHAGFQGLS